MPDLSVNDINLHYETAGKGAPLLLIAGLGSDSASWGPLIAQLPRRQMIMADNRGCGRTSGGAQDFSIEDIVSDHIALLDKLEHERVSVAGHSMGGIIAMALAAAHPDRIDKLILAATSPIVNPRARSVIETLISIRENGAPEEDWFRAFFQWLFHPSFFDNKNLVDASIAMTRAYAYKQSTADMRRQVNALREFDAASLPNAISAETLVIGASHDLLFPANALRNEFANLQNMRFDVIEESGHSLHWDQPERTANAISGFLFTS